MSVEIKRPCVICGKEAENENGTHFVGTGIMDPNAKALCQKHFEEWEASKKGRIIQFSKQNDFGVSICHDCGTLLAQGFEKTHAQTIHNSERFEYVS